MTRHPSGNVLALALLCYLAVPCGHALAQTASDPTAALVARVKPSVVQIITARPPTDDPQAKADAPANAVAQRPTTAIGSGFLIDPSGYVATNKHVVEDAVSVFVATADGVRTEARIVGITYHADIALLKIEARPGLQAAPFADSDKVRAGERVIAIGSPFGFENSVSTGIVSATNRDIMESPFDDYIQTDAAINHGNSGGPLFNQDGEVIGMNSVLIAPGAVSGSVGLGFAIPANDLKFVLERMEANEGQVRAGMLPIRTQPMTWMLAQAIAAPSLHGALVAGLEDDGDRMMEGQVKAGDVILAFNGQPVLDPRDLARKAGVAPVGSDAALDIVRGEARATVHVKVQPYPEATPPVTTARPRTIGLDLAARPGKGVAVVNVEPTGTAASSGIQKDDIILQVRQDPVRDPAQALQLMQRQGTLRRPFVAVLVQRDGKPTWIPIATAE